MHKEFRGVRGSPGEGGSAWEVSVEILYVYAFFGGLNIYHHHPASKKQKIKASHPNRERAEYCLKSTVSEERTH